MSKISHCIVVVVLLLCFSFACEESHAKRIALVVGNSNYSFGSLKNPVNDAEDISEALVDVGFEVTKILDADKRQIMESVNQFSGKISDDDVAMFFYAGHAIQVDNLNYLLSIDSKTSPEVDLDKIAVDMNYVIKSMEPAEMSIIVLDACRVNPFTN